MTLAHDRGGAGEPLLLIHGIGSQWQVWEPVLPALQAEREVVAIDLPGFGESAVLGSGRQPTVDHLADAVEAFLDEIGWERPHVAGNSLGGWLALLLSQRGRAAAACALSPAGFWNRWEHVYATLSLGNAQALVKTLEPRLEALLGNPVTKALMLGQLVAKPGRWPAEKAVAATRSLARSPGWQPTLDAMSRAHFTGGSAVRQPATVAWGEKDRLLLPRQAERARRAIPQARHVTLFGCGHVPTWDDPDLVARTILSSATA
jgi:pimeloyl-ACP methyl ester carboxylesterase